LNGGARATGGLAAMVQGRVVCGFDGLSGREAGVAPDRRLWLPERRPLSREAPAPVRQASAPEDRPILTVMAEPAFEVRSGRGVDPRPEASLRS
jgi:hypothetical protein